MRYFYAGCILASSFLVVSSADSAMICGDHDANGRIGAGDALVVLRKAVGLQSAPLVCPLLSDVTTTTQETTTSSTLCCEDQCFFDDDCDEATTGIPGLVCGGADNHSCVDCDAEDADCDTGFKCVDYDCVPE